MRALELLIEDYERRLKTITESIEKNRSNGSIVHQRREERLNTKASEYRTFIAELRRAMAVDTSASTCNLQNVTASILKDKDSFENDMAAATLNVMLKHKVVTGYKGDFGRWINCETKFRYLSNAGGIYVENLDFAATESDYHR